MGLEKTHGRNYDLARLLKGIDSGDIVLPEFQRDFLWDSTAVKQLLATCLTGWPMGSLLLLPGKSRIFFNVRPIEGAPSKPPPYQMIVLDGQQRLTSLYQALYGIGPFRYAIKLDLVENRQTIEDLEEAIISFPVSRWERSFPTPSSQYKSGLLPIAALKSASDFYAWRDTAVENEDPRGRRLLTNLYVEFLSGLDRYEIPAVVIDDEVHPEAVARIFERVNRLGQALSTFDLMVAKSFNENFNLRERWDLAQAGIPRLAAFLQGDGLPILNVIALIAKRSVRQKDILDLSGNDVRREWERSVNAVDEAIAFMRNRLGVLRPDWVPYKTQLVVLAGLARSGRLEADAEACATWFWRSTFSGRYDVASNTRAVEDYESLLSREPRPLGEIQLDREIYLTLTRRQYGATHRGVLCLLASGEPLDPFDETAITHTSGEDATLPDVGTVSFIGDPSQTRNAQALTLGTVLAWGHNARTHSTVDFETLAPAVRQSQYVPLFEAANFAGIMSARLEAISKALSQRAGVKVRIVDSSDSENSNLV